MVEQAPARARDAQLWRRSAQGDAEARNELATIVDCYARPSLARMRFQPNEVDDLVQEAQITILRYLERNPDTELPCALDAFVHRRAFGLGSRHRASRERGRANDLEAHADGLSEVALPPWAPLADADLRAALAACRERLDAEEHAAIRQRFDLELDSTESAENSGISVATVNRRLQRAYDKLRDCMMKKGLGT